ncbi:ribbon-helix-helix protein, CopG family [Streptacidiphilus sp. N1-12]|uniref:Ribbon-helix-helix protein, CopG family n=2 Tax=Streptacidiphilus alkalitolerans TaxID=3342712 RepID=A0ABV6WNG9_9ACTN
MVVSKSYAFTKELLESLSELAAQEDRSESSIVRVAVREYLARQSSTARGAHDDD